MKKRKISVSEIVAIIVFTLFSLCCLIPFLLIVSVSLSNEKEIVDFGYRLIPKTWDLQAYKFILMNPGQILSAYKITIITTVVGTAMGVFFMAMIGYALAVNTFKLRKQVTFFLFFTMLFSGGMVASYIFITQYLHLKNSIWVLILPSLISPWHVFIIRTFFQGIPQSLRESARIDGANEILIFIKIFLPISKPVIATVAFMGAMTRWNEWYSVLLYITDEKLMTLQYFLQRIMLQAELLREYAVAGDVDMTGFSIPTETVKMAMTVVAAGPMMCVFPFFQKYFVKGMTVGSVKG